MLSPVMLFHLSLKESALKNVVSAKLDVFRVINKGEAK
jgi:hypothetical protein